MILEDGKPSLLLTTSASSALLPEMAIPLVMLDRVRPEQKTDIIPTQTPVSDDTAYVIFTSGPTGRPKGVEIAHGSLLNFLHSMQDLLELTPDDRIVAVTTIAFDIATVELFLPLTVGATTVITTREVVKDPTALYRLIKRTSVSIMQATPSLWRMLLTEYPDELKGLRPLVGGEALPRDLAHMMKKLGHPVVNLYGPTETTVWSTCMPLAGGDLDTVPIGGAEVAKSYLNKPDMTAERFLPNPFLNGQGRIYRTGDLARWRPDGVVEYFGRNDHQMKVRGFRVEPGEIEAALTACGAIRQAVVVLWDDTGKSKQLVAYLTAAPAEAIDISKLPEQPAAALPPHMIPAAYVVLENMPLNTNGKIDRNALPAPQWQSFEEHVAPRTASEILLAELWCEILNIETASVNDNFFQLGGDSLAAASMVSALSRRIEGDILWSNFLGVPTIANFAKHLDEPRKQGGAIEPVLPVRAKGSHPPLFCIHPVMGLGWAFTSLAQHINENIPIYAMQADGVNDSSMLPQSIEDMAERYLRRIKEIQPQGPYYILGWSFGGLIAHEISRLLHKEEDEIAFLALLDSYPFMPPTGTAFNNETVLAKAALSFLGFGESVLGDRPAFAALGDFLSEEYRLEENVFFKEIAQHDPRFMERLRTVILHHLDIAQRFVPGRIDSNVHFFSAKPASSKTIHGVLNYHVEAWLPHIGGRIHRHELECAHEEMLEQGNAMKIASIFMEQALRNAPSRMHSSDAHDSATKARARL